MRTGLQIGPRERRAGAGVDRVSRCCLAVEMMALEPAAQPSWRVSAHADASLRRASDGRELHGMARSACAVSRAS